MNYNYKKILVLLIPILLIIALSVYITKIFNSVGVLFFDFSIAFIIIFTTLLLTKQQVFYTWLRFATIFLSISIILIAISPSINGSLIGFDKKSATFSLAISFLIISLSLITTKSFRPSWRLWLILPVAFVLSIIVLIAIASIL